MTLDPSPKNLYSLGVALLFCGIGITCIGLGIILFLNRTGQIDRMSWESRWEGQPGTDYRHIPPEWIAYQQTAVFQCPVPSPPTCFMVQNDSTYIIGTADPPALLFFDDKGTLLKKMDLPEEPRAVACGTSDTILTDKIVVVHPKRIAVYTAEGNQEGSWLIPWNDANITWREQLPEQPMFHSKGNIEGENFGLEFNARCLVLTPNHLFVAESRARRVYRFDAEGNHDRTFGESKGAPPGTQFSWMENKNYFGGFVVYASPIMMTYSPQADLLYITNPGKHRVEAFTLDGLYQPELSWGETSASLSGFAGCCNPTWLETLDDGRILTVEKSVSRIKIYRTDGQLDCVVAGANSLNDQLPESRRMPLQLDQRYFGVAVLSEGRIAIFDFGFSLIRIFSLRLLPDEK